MIKNFKSTESLYGVNPCYFEGMSYFEAIEKKIELAKLRINLINGLIDYTLPEDKYKELNRQLNECEKAKRFNEMLLEEYKHCKGKK